MLHTTRRPGTPSLWFSEQVRWSILDQHLQSHLQAETRKTYRAVLSEPTLVIPPNLLPDSMDVDTPSNLPQKRPLDTPKEVPATQQNMSKKKKKKGISKIRAGITLSVP